MPDIDFASIGLAIKTDGFGVPSHLVVTLPSGAKDHIPFPIVGAILLEDVSGVLLTELGGRVLLQ
jgi:hypothetical protein